MSQKQVLDEKTRALGDERFTARKNRFKKVRTVFQLLVIVGVLVLLFTVFFSLKEYQAGWNLCGRNTRRRRTFKRNRIEVERSRQTDRNRSGRGGN